MSNLFGPLTFTTGSDGAAATTANTGLDFISPTTPTISTAQYFDTTRSLLVNCSSNTQYGYKDFSSTSVGIFEGFFYLDSLSTTGYLWNILNSGTNKAQVRLLTDRTPQLRDGTDSSSSSASGTLSASTWYRFKWVIAASTQTLYFYVGNSTTAAVTVTANYTGGAFTRFQVGNIASATIKYWVDSLIGDTNTERGPLVTPPTVTMPGNVSTYTTLVPTVTASVSGNTGTTTYAWSRVSGPTVTFGTASAVGTTVTNTGGAGDTVLGFTVTDNSGTTPMQYVTITWAAPAASGGVMAVVSNTGWTPTGGTALQCAQDATGTLYELSGTNPSASVLALQYVPITAPPGNLTVTSPACRRVGGSSGTVTPTLKTSTGTTVKVGSALTLPSGSTRDQVQATFLAADIASADWPNGVRIDWSFSAS